MIRDALLLLFVVAAAVPATDRFGDPLPEGAVQRLGTLRMRYRSIGDLCYLPDGRPLVATGSDLEIWDPETGLPAAKQRVGSAALVSVEPRRDGKLLLIADSAGNVLEWDLAAQKVVRQWATGQRGLRVARYSPDEKRVLTTGGAPPTLKEWDRESGKELAAITGKMHSFSEAVYGPDGRTAFVSGSAGSDPILAHYDLARGTLLKEWLNDYYSHARSLTLSPDGQRLLLGSRHKATEWQVEGLKPLGTFTGHHGHAVTAVAYCADPDQLLTGSRDGSIRRWSRATGKVLFRWVPHNGHVTRIRVSPDGKWVLSYGGCLVAESSLADGTPRHDLQRHHQGVRDVSVLTTGDVASASADGTLRLWSPGTGECRKTLSGATLGAYCLALAPNGGRAAAGCKDGIVREFDLAAGRVVRERKGHRGYIRAVAYIRTGRELLSSADDGSIRIWGEGDTPEKVLEGHRGGVLSIALSPDDTLVLSGGRDGTVRLWDWRRAALLHTWEGHRGWVEAVLFSLDGRFAYSAGRDGRILKRAVESGRIVGEMVPGGRVLSLAGTPDGRLLFAGGEDGAITCWNAATGKQVRKLEGHTGAVNALAVTHDGKRLLTASEDTTLLVWNVPSGG